MNASELFIRQPLLLEALTAFLTGLSATDGAHISCLSMPDSVVSVFKDTRIKLRIPQRPISSLICKDKELSADMLFAAHHRCQCDPFFLVQLASQFFEQFTHEKVLYIYFPSRI